MGRPDIGAAVQVGDCPGYFQDSGMGPGAQAESFHGFFKEAARWGIDGTVLSNMPAVHAGVGEDFGSGKTIALDFSSIHDPFQNLG